MKTNENNPNDVPAMVCGRCQGSGVDPHWGTSCCRRSNWECGGKGCTGPVPEQLPCSFCGGGGVVPNFGGMEKT